MAIQTATNPQTGETVALVKNQWVPVSQTATNDKGQKAYLVNNQWLTDEMAAPPVKEAGFSLGDLGASFGIGAAGSTKALTDVAGAGNVLSSKLEGATESLQKSMTPERQAELKRQQARMKAAEESGSILEEIKAAALNVAEAPLQSAAQAVGSFVPYLPALLASPVAAALGLTGRSLSVITSIAQKAPAVIGTAQGAGAVKGSIYEGVLKAEIESGVDPELAKQKATAAQDYFGKNFDQIALGSGLGLVAGTKGVEKLFTPAGRATVAPGTARRIGETVVKESIPEAAQGAQERVAQNIALQREGRDVETFKGAAGAATQEALTGALGAAPIAALSKPDTTIAAKKEQDKFEQEKQEFRKAYGEAKPVEVKEPEEPVEFPGGYTAIPRELSRQDVPESYGIFPEGSDKPLTTVKTQEEAQAKLQTLSEIRAEEQSRLAAESEKISADINAEQRKLDVMEATGLTDTDQYVQAKAAYDQKAAEATQKIDEITQRIADYSAPLTLAPVGTRTDVQNEYVVKRGDQEIGAFPTLQAAELKLREIDPDTFKQAEETARAETDDRVQQLKQTLTPMLERFGLKDVGLNIVEKIENNAGGRYLDSLIDISLREQNPVQTLRHESLHALKDLGFFTPQQYKALEERANKQWIKEYLQDQTAEIEVDGKPVQMSRLDAYKRLGYSQEAIVEEAIADAFGAYARGATPPPGMIAALFKKLKNFFMNFGQALRGAGFESAEDVFQRVERGELKSRKPKVESARKTEAEPKLEEEEDVKETAEKLSLKTVQDVINDGIDRLVKTARKGRIREDQDRFAVGNARVDTNLTKVQDGIEKRLMELGVSTKRDERGDRELDLVIYGKVLPAYRAKLKEIEGVRFGEEKFSLAPKDIPQKIWELHEKSLEADEKARYYNVGPLKATATKASNRLVRAAAEMFPNDDQAQLALMVKMNEESSRRQRDAEEKADEALYIKQQYSLKMVEQADKYEEENGIRPYVSEGELDLPIKAPKYSLQKFNPDKHLKFDPTLGVPINKNGTVTVYYHTTKQKSLEIGKNKVIPSEGRSRVYLTNESGGDAILRDKGNFDQEFDGSTVLVYVTPDMLQLDAEYDNGRRDFFIPLAEGDFFNKKMKMQSIQKGRDEAITGEFSYADHEKKMSKALDAYKNASPAERKKILAQARKTLKTEHNVGSLLSENGKLEKTRVGEYGLDYEGNSVASQGLGLAAAQKITEKVSTCPRSAICEGLCLGETSGGNFLFGGTATEDVDDIKKSAFRAGPRMMQYLKTEALIINPEAFAVLLQAEIDSLKKWSASPTQIKIDPETKKRVKVDKEIYQPAVRLNVTSDFKPEMFRGIIEGNPDVQFYDYTKLGNEPLSSNHHLTYSSTGFGQIVNGEKVFFKTKAGQYDHNWATMRKRLDNGQNVAMAFSSKSALPKTLLDEETNTEYRIWDGDDYDARFLDPKQPDGKGMIIGLRNKAGNLSEKNATERTGGFFVQYNPKTDGDTVVVPDQAQFKDGGRKVIPVAKAEKFSLRAPTTPEFKRWFGDSKVVDADGNPLVVYHGTGKDFSKFEYNELKALGSWFAAGPQLASQYSEIVSRGGDSPRVMPVYLSMQNPANEQDLQKATEQAEKEKNRDFGKINKRRREILQAQGFDGVLLSDTFVVFSPNQIKSATGNVGTYDPENPDIRYSLRKGSPELKQWAGKTTIVDADGNPRAMYHGLAKDTTDFTRKTERGAPIFLTDDPDFAARFAADSYESVAKNPEKYLTAEQIKDGVKRAIAAIRKDYGKDSFGKEMIESLKAGNLKEAMPEAREYMVKELVSLLPTGPHIMKLYVRAERPFDYTNSRHIDRLKEEVELDADIWRSIREGDWDAIESGEVQDAIKMAGFDSFYVKEHGRKNLAVYEPNQVKSATGNVGTFSRESNDVRYSLKNVAFPSAEEAKKAVAATSVPKTEEFKLFIAGNQWVDEDGGQKVFYHGTASEFFEFTPAGKASAIYLADTPEEAEAFGKIAEDRLRQQIYRALTKDEKVDFFQGIVDAKVDSGSMTEKEGADFMRQVKRKAPEFGDFGDLEKETRAALIDLSPTRTAIMPLYARAETPFDFRNPDHVAQVAQAVRRPDAKLSEEFKQEAREMGAPTEYPDQWYRGLPGLLKQGYLTTIEQEPVQTAIRRLGFDGYVARRNRNSPVVYAVYKPEQVKSATGNLGEYGRESKNIKYSLPTIPQQITDRIGETTTKAQRKTVIQNIIEAITPTSAADFRAKYLNRYNQMSVYDKKLAEKMGGAALLADQSAESAALMSDLGAGVASSAMGYGDRHGGIPVLRNGITTIDRSVKGLVPSLAPLAAYNDPVVYQRYQYWAMVKRGQRLNSQGKLTGIDTADVAFAKVLEQKHPEFVSVQKDLIAFNNGLVQYMVDTGVLSKERGQMYTKYADYIPFYRQMDGGETLGPNLFQSLSNVKPPKMLKGADVAEAPIADFLETMVRNTQSSIQAGIKNYAAQRALNVAMQVKAPGMGAERLNFKSNAPDVINVLEKGNLVSYRTADPLLVNAMMSLNQSEIPFIGFLSAPADLLRSLVTKDPGFMMANILRDSLSAWVTSGVKMTPIAGTVINYGKAIARKSPGFEAMQDAGIIGGYEFSDNVEKSGFKLEDDLAKKAGKKDPILLRPFTSVWDALEKGTTASDSATRALIYERVLKETGNEAEALYRSLEVMNFHRKGSSPLIRVLTAAVPFFNARLQGLDLFYRASTGNMNNKDAKAIQRQFLMRGGLMAGLSVAYWFMVSDDEEYKKQEQETKDNNWIAPSIRAKIPIPFEVGVLFKVIPERIAAYLFGNDTGEDLKKSMLRSVVNTFAFNPIPQTIKPVLEAYVDFNFFTMRPILGQGMKDIEPEFQVGPNTSKVATGLAQGLGLSPIKVDHILKGYTGTIGTYLIDTVDAVLDQFGNSPKPTKRFEQLPVIKRFVADPEARGYVTQFYELKDAVETTVRTMNLLEKTGQIEEYVEYVIKNQGRLALKDDINNTEKKLTELRDMRTAVRSSGMGGDEKRDALLAISKMESALTSNIQTMKKVISSVQ